MPKDIHKFLNMVSIWTIPRFGSEQHWNGNIMLGMFWVLCVQPSFHNYVNSSWTRRVFNANEVNFPSKPLNDSFFRIKFFSMIFSMTNDCREFPTIIIKPAFDFGESWRGWWWTNPKGVDDKVPLDMKLIKPEPNRRVAHRLDVSRVKQLSSRNNLSPVHVMSALEWLCVDGKQFLSIIDEIQFLDIQFKFPQMHC